MPGYLSTSFDPNEAAAASDLASSASDAASRAIGYASGASDAASAAAVKAAAASSKIAAHSSAWGGGAIPDASETAKGKIEIATLSEALLGSDVVRAITPAGLKHALDNRVPIPWPAYHVHNTWQYTDKLGASVTWKVEPDSILVNNGGCYSLDTGLFTAPVKGLYDFAITVQLLGILSTHVGFYLYLMTTQKNYIHDTVLASSQHRRTYALHENVLSVPMDAGDTAYWLCKVSPSTQVVDVYGEAVNIYTRIMGHLVCKAD
jgi:hypothetical protein